MTIGTKWRQTKQSLAGNEIAGTNSTYHTVKQCGEMYSAVEGVAPEWGAAVRRRRTHNNFAMSRYTLALVLLAAGLHFIGIDGQNHPIRDALFLGNQSLSNSTLDDCIWRRGGEFDVCPDPDIVYNLYTADEPHAKKQIDLSSEDWLRQSGWDPLHETVFIVHGYAGGDDLLPIIVLRDAYLRRGSYNVIMMDWGPLARAPCYPAAVHNLRAGARCAAQALAELRRAGLRPERLTCVGHSLGAHLCGIISNYLTFRMYRIIGLDPARPLIRAAPALRLDAGDARAVHVLHTNAGKYGEAARLGTADFCLNGGRNQPFCYDTPNEALCSHIWSICYQAESIFKQRMAEPCGRRCGARPTRARSVSARAALPVPLGQQAPMAATGAFCIEDTLPPFCPKYASGEGDERCCLDKQYAAAAALDTTTRRPFARLREARRRNQEDLYDRTYALPWTITNNRLD